jgi:hypothetical protein
VWLRSASCSTKSATRVCSMAAASQDEAAFMAALLGDLNASMFSEPPSSPGKAAAPKRVPLSRRIVNVKPSITKPLAKRPVKHVEIAATPVVDNTLDDLCDGIAWSDFDTDMEPEELPRVSAGHQQPPKLICSSHR